MSEKYADPKDSDLRIALHDEGKVVFLLTRREVSFLKKMTDAEMQLVMTNRRPGWRNRLHVKYHIVSVMFNTIFAAIFLPKLINIFGLYATDKEFIRNIHTEPLPNGLVEVTFHKKKM